jgi:hypothetical protein
MCVCLYICIRACVLYTSVLVLSTDARWQNVLQMYSATVQVMAAILIPHLTEYVQVEQFWRATLEYTSVMTSFCWTLQEVLTTDYILYPSLRGSPHMRNISCGDHS